MTCKVRCPECRMACRSNHKGNGGTMNGLEEVGLVPIAPATHAHLVWLKPNRKGIRAFRSIHAWMHQDDDMRQRFLLRGMKDKEGI